MVVVKLEELEPARRSMYNRLADFLINNLNVDRISTVLEAGCGSGRLTVPLADRIGEGRKIIAFDIVFKFDIICHYASGNIETLLPIMLKAGFNTFAPLEVAAGMDAIKLREHHGNRILLMGNISRQALMDGPKAVEKEFYGKVPYLMEQGGYIAAADDMILPDISFQSFKHYINLLKSMQL